MAKISFSSLGLVIPKPIQGPGVGINLTRTSLAPWAKVRTGLQLAIVGLCLLMAFLCQEWWTASQRLQDLHLSVARVKAQLDRVDEEARHEGVVLSPDTLHALPQQVEATNLLIARHGASYSIFLSMLEHLLPARMSVTRVSVDVAQPLLLQMSGQATNLVELQSFLDAMLKDHHVEQAQLLKQDTADSGLVRFDARVTLRSQGTTS